VRAHPVKGTVDDLLTTVAGGGIDQVWVTLPLRAEARVREMLERLREHAVEIRFVPDIYGFHLLNHSFTEIAGLPVISLTETPMAGVNRMTKAVEDYVLATLAVVLLAPAMAMIALAVRLSSPGPVLYRQERVTWNGEHFWMFKFRTMPIDAESQSGPVWSRRAEPRATRVGRFLRRFSLDELPQLFNVLRGEMSIVGPRPERPEFVEQFRREIPGYMQKHLVKAGITGWAQINGWRGEMDSDEKIRQRTAFDLFYIENWSLFFDLKILFLTPIRLLNTENAY
jgi:putative colanic acid biosynthesis UDP-glucose lipid carrier transferase